ncbi:hypothetical protein V8F33_009845 [Rhypophila sp. PSN 637]
MKRQPQSVQAKTVAKRNQYMTIIGYSGRRLAKRAKRRIRNLVLFRVLTVFRRKLAKRLRKRITYLVLFGLLAVVLLFPLVVSVNLHWNPIEGESKARSGYNTAMEIHQYIANERSAFLRRMRYQRGWIAWLQKIFRLRVLEFGADVCLFVYSFYLRNFRSLCGAVGKNVVRCRVVEAWDLLGGPFRFGYWYFPGRDNGFCWLYRTCPGMNWEWWNTIMRWVYLWSFDGLWNIKSMPWGWLSTALVWALGLGAGYRAWGLYNLYYW